MTEIELDEQGLNGESDGKLGLSCTLDMFKEYDEIKSMISNINIDCIKPLTAEKKFEDFKTIIDQYQEQPHLLDQHLESLLDLLVTLIRNSASSKDELALAFKYLWLIVKVRGYKYVIKKMPHEFKDLLPVLKLLEDQENETEFHGSYVLLMWLSIILYMPFNMTKFDVSAHKVESKEEETVVGRILVLIKKYLQAPHSSREIAAYLGSRFVTRPDLIIEELPKLITYCFEVLQISESEKRIALFHKMGALRTLGLIFKNGKREELLPHAANVLNQLLASGMLERQDTPLQKYSTKLVQRIGLTFLKPRLASWRYQRGSRSLATNVAEDKKMNKDFVADAEEDDEDIDPAMEEVIDVLLQGISKNDTVVRWSAAKGVGRITSRLPRELADDVVGAILEKFTNRESDKAWHGGCLALAELARRGLFLPERLSEVLPILEKALVYDELRGQSSIGSNIRDAACYLSWAFARAYNPDQMAPFVHQLATGLLIVSLFDREIPCRRAGSAAFQEHVGRQGSFPFGIEILTAVDYFAVGNRANAFLQLGVHVGQYKTYTVALINHLVERKMGHWDSTVRDLAAKALANLTEFEPDYMSGTVLPSILKSCTCSILILRHGALLASGHVVLALANIARKQNNTLQHFIGADMVEEICRIVPELDERKLYRGMGGEYMKQATAVLIAKCAQASLPMENRQILDKWHTLLEDCLIYVDESIRLEALEALSPVWRTYFMEDQDWQTALLERYTVGLQGSIENHTIGFAAGLGAMPEHFLKGKLVGVLEALQNTTKVTPNTVAWAKARKEAINSIVKIVNTMGVEPQGDEQERICIGNIGRMYECLLEALNDYTMDRRGDVGAWVRETAMGALQDISSAICAKDADIISDDISQRIIENILQQSVERIDRTRKVAGQTLQAFLYSIKLKNIPRRDELCQIFDEEWCLDCNWASESTTFQKFVHILDLPEYRTKTLLGLTYSLGGTSANLSRYTCDAIQNYLNSRMESPEMLRQFLLSILDLFNTFQRQDRITLPLIKSVGEILSACSALDQTLENDLLPQLIGCLRRECAKCTDYYKLSAAITVLCELLRIPSDSTKTILTQLSIFLGYQYPKVRAITATCLLSSLQEYTDHDVIPDHSMEAVCDLLEDTAWMGSIEEARQQRNVICGLIGIPTPQTKPKT